VQQTPKSFRLHIGFFGRRNVGKSSLINAIFRQQVSIVSDIAGTTTDPVEKPMELLPLGPVLFIDTGGIDDIGALGSLRVEKTRRVFDRTDLGVVVTDAGIWGDFEKTIIAELKERGIPAIVVFNKIDQATAPQTMDAIRRQGVSVVETAAVSGSGISDFRQALIDNAPDPYINSLGILSDLVGPGELALLVVPIDKEAPRGRLIMPQVQTIRDLLDNDALCMVAQAHSLKKAFESLKNRLNSL
jgi:[FeFe] hydrogenase H-cluster maturation GTPase HydF